MEHCDKEQATSQAKLCKMSQQVHFFFLARDRDSIRKTYCYCLFVVSQVANRNAELTTFYVFGM